MTSKKLGAMPFEAAPQFFLCEIFFAPGRRIDRFARPLRAPRTTAPDGQPGAHPTEGSSHRHRVVDREDALGAGHAVEDR